MKQFKHKKKVVLTTSLVGLMAIGGISAYFTDGDTATNEFTIGRISIDLQEPNWIPPTNITPNQTIKKDPQIKNDGINEAYVFLEVTVPYKNIVVAELNGIKKPAADTELFTYTVNNGWTEIGTPKKDTVNGTVTHLYAFAKDNVCQALLKGETTPALFDTVTFVNATEDQGLEETNKEIVINAYGIQTKDINGSGANGKTAPADVWTVLSKQAPTTVVDVEEGKNSDIKGEKIEYTDFTLTRDNFNMIGIDRNASVVEIPEIFKYDGVNYKVTKLGYDIPVNDYEDTLTGPFSGCFNLTSVEIPNSVTMIGGAAFFEAGLTSVEIPDSVTMIGEYAFSAAPLTSVKIPNSVISIGKNAFNECESLISIEIPNSVTSIGENAFWQCAFISVEIPNNITSIGKGAFEDCKNLTSITWKGTTYTEKAVFNQALKDAGIATEDVWI